MTARRLRRRERGQGLVEVALVVPIIMLLFLGVYTAADLANGKDTVVHAAREGARIAAEIGNNGYKTGTNAKSGCQTSATDPCIVDNEILKSVIPILTQQLSHGAVTEIDIYQPQTCPSGTSGTYSSPGSGGCPPDNGAWQSGDRIDRYNPDGTVMSSSPQSYTLDQRSQIHPNEASVGVRIVFHYTSPTLRIFTMDDTEYSVVRLAPIFT
jgi:hypothetical protein